MSDHCASTARVKNVNWHPCNAAISSFSPGSNKISRLRTDWTQTVNK